jgi:hypothetical protein
MTGPELLAAGRLIEAGWESWRLDHFAQVASSSSLAKLRDCFFAGALHAAATMLMLADPDAISAELIEWSKSTERANP